MSLQSFTLSAALTNTFVPIASNCSLFPAKTNKSVSIVGIRQSTFSSLQNLRSIGIYCLSLIRHTICVLSQKYNAGASSVISVPMIIKSTFNFSAAQRKACINSTRRPTLVKSIFILLSFCISTAKQTFSHLHLPRISA